MDTLQFISIILELLIFLIALQLGVKKHKTYGYAFAFTFGVYVLYDLSHLFNFSIPSETLRLLFFFGTLSALYAVLQLKGGKK